MSFNGLAAAITAVKSQKLLSAPAKLPDGCAKMQYRMSGETSWSNSIPVAAKAGNYTVEYRYAGDKNHKTSAVFRIKASIARAKITITAQDKTSPREASIKKLTWKVTGGQGRNSGFTNARRVTVQKDSYTLGAGKTAMIKAETVLEIQGKKLLGNDHDARYRYSSDNNKVATVDENGKITAVGKGTCHIYIYAQNGTSKKVSVTVK